MKSLKIIIGNCALETMEISEKSVETVIALFNDLIPYAAGLGVELDFYYKSCYYKANRTDRNSFHGVGLGEGLKMLSTLKRRYGVKITSDVHSFEEVDIIGPILDIIQIPQSLSRYTRLVELAARTARFTKHKISIKKGIFMNYNELESAYLKANDILPQEDIIMIERGNRFGYNDIIVDFLVLKDMKRYASQICIDASHSARARDNIFEIAKAGIIFGANWVFLEAHPYPNEALCDGKTSLLLEKDILKQQLMELVQLRSTLS